MKLLKLAAKSAWNRKVSLLLTMFSIAISIMLLLGVDQIRKSAKNSFVNTIANTDLIVGARSGPVNLLLYSVFRIGNATNNISYQAYQELTSPPKIKWAIPISLGDSHQGFRVMGTTQDYFKFYRYANNLELKFSKGQEFSNTYDTVLGADVAKELGYKLQDRIILAHGLVSTEFSEHKEHPFTVTGILEKTGTPVDRTVHVSLDGIEAIHIGWETGAPRKNSGVAVKTDTTLIPKSITAFMLGLTNRINTFRVQREINEYKKEPLMAIIPGATLSDLWQTVGIFEKVLFVISSLVLVAGLIGLLTALLTSLAERRREMAVLRATGAHAHHIILLFVLEALLIVGGGCVLGVVFLYAAEIIAQPIIARLYGFQLIIKTLDFEQVLLLLGAVGLGIILSLVPGVIAYKKSLQDGLMIKV